MTRTLVEKALRLLREKYVFPDRAASAALAIEKRFSDGEYDGLEDASFAKRLTKQLYEVCRDKHLRVRLRQPDYQDAVSETELRTAWREEMRLANQGIAKVQRLDGNVGYIDLRAITDPGGAGGRVIAAAISWRRRERAQREAQGGGWGRLGVAYQEGTAEAQPCRCGATTSASGRGGSDH